MRRLLFLFVFFLGVTFYVAAEEVAINFSDPMFAQLDVEGKDLLAEYAKNYPKIKSFYENMRMDVDVRKTIYPSEKSLESLVLILQSEGLGEDEINVMLKRSSQTDMRYEVRHRQPDGYGRVDMIINQFMTDYVRSKLPSGSSLHNFSDGDVVQNFVITLLTPTTGYQLSKNDSSKQHFSLNARRSLTNSAVDDIGLPIVYFDTAPYSSNGMPLEEIVFQSPPLIKEKPYIVNYVRQKELDGRKIVEIKTSRADLTDSFRRITLDRKSWGVLEVYARSGLTLSSGEREINWTHEMCTYVENADDVPVLKTYQRSFGKYDKDFQNDRIIERIECKITQVIPGPPDLSEFDVAQFLQPGINIGEITRAQLTPGRIAAIAFGIILIILGIYLKVRSMRKQ